MKTLVRLLSTVLLIISTGNHATAQDPLKAHKDSLDIIVTMYYDLNLKIFQANSTIGDIDHVFELFTDDFTYVHPKYGGTYTREDLYEGYIRNQKNKAYNGTVADIKIENKIFGLNAAVVQRRFVEKKGVGTENGNPEMTFFEFRDGKISRIFEYW